MTVSSIENSTTQVPFAIRSPRAYIAKRSVQARRETVPWKRIRYSDLSGCPLLDDLMQQRYWERLPGVTKWDAAFSPSPRPISGIDVTFFSDKFAKTKRVITLRLEELCYGILHTNAACADVQSPEAVDAAKATLPWLKLALFGSEKSNAGSLRHDENMVSISGVEGDYDGGEMSLDEAVAIAEKAKLRVLLYTSPRHTDEKPRWRILVPTSHAWGPHARKQLLDWVQQLYGGILSQESYTPSQAYYYGSVGNNTAHWAVVTDGKYVDQYVTITPPENITTKKTKKTTTTTKNGGKKQYNPFTQVDLEPDMVRRALNVIPNTVDIKRADWINILHEAHEGSGGSDDVLAAVIAWTLTWDGWALDEYKHDKRHCAEYTTEVWKGLRPRGERTRASLYDRADAASGTGWRRAQESAPSLPSTGGGQIGEAPEREDVTDESPTKKPGKNDWQASELFDPWAQYYVPKFPLDVLPPQVQEFVAAQGEVIGCSVSAMAMAVLATFSGSLSHEFSLKLMRHGDWYASPRLWVLLYGDPSYKKTPIFDAATKPLEAHQARVQEQYRFNLKAAEASGGDKPPEPERYVTYDITPEKMGELMARNPRGLLAKHDEFSGWLGHMERYGGKGGQSTKAFWLKTFDGGPHVHDRIGRGSIFIQNISSSLLAGIQPKKLAALGNLTADGLLQRFIPYVMTEQRLARDCPSNNQWYNALVQELILAPAQVLSLSDPALDVMNALREHLHGLELITGGLAEGFQSFIGKLHGIAGSLTLILHKIAAPNGGTIVEKKTVENVQRLVADFILPHAMEFYHCAENANNGGDPLHKAASYILTSGKERLVVSDLTSNVADLRGLSVRDVNERMSPLVATDWIRPEAHGIENRAWSVNPNVHKQFAVRSKEEETRKAELAKLMKSTRRDRP